MLYIAGKGNLPSCTSCTTLFISPHLEKPYLPCSSSASLGDGTTIHTLNVLVRTLCIISNTGLSCTTLSIPSPSQWMLVCLPVALQVAGGSSPHPTATRAGHQHLLPGLLQPPVDICLPPLQPPPPAPLQKSASNSTANTNHPGTLLKCRACD